MKGKLVYSIKKYEADGSFHEIRIWQVSVTTDKPHGLKYSFAYILDGERVIGYDNSEDKGDHRHFRGKESAYKFESLEKLWKDFKRDIKRLREGKQ